MSRLYGHSAGLGKAPKARDQDSYEHYYHHCEVMVVGGGIAGLQAARSAAATGVRVLLVEQTAHWGGRAPVDGVLIDGMAAERVGCANFERACRRRQCCDPQSHPGLWGL